MSKPIKEPPYVARTLAWCNRQRKKQGKPPMKKLPKGRRRDADSCPCGKATGLTVGVITYQGRGRNRKTITGRNPGSVQAFVLAFDNQMLPQYEL